MIIKCIKCGKKRNVFPSRIKIGSGKFCSVICSNTFNNTGEKNPMYGRKGELAPTYGKRGKDSRNWKGGRISLRGYIMVIAPEDHPYKKKDGRIAEHRLVMEKKLGRYLDPKEVVHHMNHIKDDNREENLMLLENSSEHGKLHGKKKGTPMHPNTRKALQKWINRGKPLKIK